MSRSHHTASTHLPELCACFTYLGKQLTQAATHAAFTLLKPAPLITAELDMKVRDHKTLFLHLTAAKTSSTMTDPSTTTNAPFRFLDLPTELRLEIYKHVANNTHQRRFFSKVPVSLHETDFSILACCKPIHNEAYECMRKAVLDQSPTIKLAYDEEQLGLHEDMQFFILQILRQITKMLILGRKADYSDTDTDIVPTEPLHAVWRDMRAYHTEHERNMGSAIDKADVSSFFRKSILQMRRYSQIIVEVITTPGARQLGDEEFRGLLTFGVGGNGIDASSLVKVTFVFVVPPEQVESLQLKMPSESDLFFSARCERVVEVISDGSDRKSEESATTGIA